MKNLIHIEKVDEEELIPLRKEFYSFENLLQTGKFYNSYTHNDSFFVSVRDVLYKKEYEVEREKVIAFGNTLPSKITKEGKNFTKILSFLENFANNHRSSLQRVIVVKTLNEYRYFPHVDKGYYYLFHKRYHLILCGRGTSMLSGAEEKVFKAGDIFYLNNLAVHSGKNFYENDERIHVIFDILPRNPFAIVYRYIHWFFIERRVPFVNNMSLIAGAAGLFYLGLALRRGILPDTNK